MVGSWSGIGRSCSRVGLSWSGVVGSWSELVGVAPSCGFSDHWGCLGRFGCIFALLWVVLTTVAPLFTSFWWFRGHFGVFRLIFAVWGTLWGTFGHPGGHIWPHLGALGVLFGVIWDLLGPLWAPWGRPGAARGGKVEKEAGGSENLTTFWSHFGRVWGA